MNPCQYCGKPLDPFKDACPSCGAAGAAAPPGSRRACPRCNLPLHLSERQGVEIDYCMKCRGVWLDNGELEKILDQVALMSRKLTPQYSAPPPAHHYPAEHKSHKKYKHYGYFLKAIFDILD